VLTYFLTLSIFLSIATCELFHKKFRINFSGQNHIKRGTVEKSFSSVDFINFKKEILKMSETTSNDQGLVKKDLTNGADKTGNEYMGDFKVQAQEYGQKLQDAATKARDYANEQFTVATDKFKELQQKDPKELVEDAKEYARQKPGQTILISAAVGLVLGWIFRSGRK